jgi:molybdopterin molybdotransferase
MTEPDVSTLISVEEAVAILDAAVVRPRVISSRLADASGLRLARDVTADRDFPPFDKSMMDGFALRSADAAGDVALQIVGEIPAGAVPERELRAGQAMAIMTGAPLPPGADAVLPVEMTDRAGEKLRLLQAPAPGRFISARGSDCRAGATVLTAGTLLGAAQLAAAAAVGAARIDVFARPRVAVLSTGDELVNIDQVPQGAQIRNSNNIMLVDLLRRLGCDVHDLHSARDDQNAIHAAIESALDSHDAVLVSGGMSMGRYDLVPGVLTSLGAVIHITKLKIKPGKPFVYAHVDRAGGHRCHIFGLPGNPLAGFVCVVRLCARLLARLAGGTPQEKWLRAELASPLPANGPREFYQPAEHRDGKVTPLRWNGSADVFTLARANALCVRAESEPARSAGETVRLLEIPI